MGPYGRWWAGPSGSEKPLMGSLIPKVLLGGFSGRMLLGSVLGEGDWTLLSESP